MCLWLMSACPPFFSSSQYASAEYCLWFPMPFLDMFCSMLCASLNQHIASPRSKAQTDIHSLDPHLHHLDLLTCSLRSRSLPCLVKFMFSRPVCFWVLTMKWAPVHALQTPATSNTNPPVCPQNLTLFCCAAPPNTPYLAAQIPELFPVCGQQRGPFPSLPTCCGALSFMVPLP